MCMIALADLTAGTTVPELAAPLAHAIPRGHKIATTAIAPGQNVLRYGQIIGVATAPIAAGDHIHSHNLGMGTHDLDYAFASEHNPQPVVTEKRTFMGYHRADGTVGTRNYLGILTSVNCSGSVAKFIAEATGAGRLAERLPQYRRRRAHRPRHRLRHERSRMRAMTPCSAPCRAMRATRTLAASCWWVWAARSCRSPT